MFLKTSSSALTLPKKKKENSLQVSVFKKKKSKTFKCSGFSTHSVSLSSGQVETFHIFNKSYISILTSKEQLNLKRLSKHCEKVLIQPLEDYFAVMIGSLQVSVQLYTGDINRLTCNFKQIERKNINKIFFADHVLVYKL